MRTAFLLVADILGTLGCTSTILMRHPDGRVAECGGSYAFGLHSMSAAERDRDCVNDFQRQGFERAPK
jgi:hypothetical protein